jgi:peptidoglycan hydrolase CwlO-like protein
MHLVVLQKENAELMGQNQDLQGQNDQYEHRIKDLKQEIETSQAKLTELVEKQSRGWFRNIFKRG